MRTIIVAVLIVFTIFAGTISASGYKITKVIEVGRGWGPVVGPLKWSPGGDKLAYFNKTALYVSDTLGVTREIVSLGLPGYRYEWLNNEEVVIGLHAQMPDRSVVDSILIVDINTNQKTVVDAYNGPRYPDPTGDIWLNDGPWLTVEGNVYYRAHINPWRNSESQGKLKLLQSQYSEIRDTSIARENHILSWEPDGLYLIRCDLLDSMRIAPRPYQHILFLPTMSPDKSYYMLGGTIYRFSDSTYIILDTLSAKLAQGTIQCDFMDHSFNPRSPEVIFQLMCDDDVQYEVSRVGIYDFTTSEMTILDPLIGIEQCEMPAYNPDGCKLALCSKGKVYMVYRESIGE